MFPFITIPQPIIDGITDAGTGSDDVVTEDYVANSGHNVSDSFEGSETPTGSPVDYNFLEYLEGLFASQGAENEINRKFNSAEAAANRQFQSREAEVQRNWYETMSNTAYQRAVSDMKKAGINPILAYQHGGAAASGTGIATGSAASYSATGGDTLAGVVNAIAGLVDTISGLSSGKLSTVYKVFNLFR